MTTPFKTSNFTILDIHLATLLIKTHKAKQMYKYQFQFKSV